MCRFLIYRGRGMFMSDLLTKADRSLIHQSFKAREREEPLNGDGFGVGWYSPEIDTTPCAFTSTTPAWSNRNLHRLAEKIRSPCFFAHVRAATPGLVVSEVNCHPFEHGRFLWMHNGAVGEFLKIRRPLRESLDDELYNFIQGTTDSEHAFAVFLNYLKPYMNGYTLSDLADAMSATIEQLNIWTRAAEVARPCRYNFAVTDGHNIVATRYSSDPETLIESLYVSVGDRFENIDGRYRMAPTEADNRAIIITSEPLTDELSDWQEVPINHMVTVSPEMHLDIKPVH